MLMWFGGQHLPYWDSNFESFQFGHWRARACFASGKRDIGPFSQVF